MPDTTPTTTGEDLTKIVPVVLTTEELAARAVDMMVLQEALKQRDQSHPELDDMTYLQYYDANRKKDLSYMAKKQNKQDVRISTGITREKDTTLLSTLLNMNFQPDITAFDHEDLVVAELGDNMSDMVKKSREIEDWEQKRSLIYRELISQGDVFVQEMKVEEFRDMPLEDIEWNPANGKIADFAYASRLKKLFTNCECRMVNGKMVLLGNIREPFIKNQETVALMRVYNTRERAESRYKSWDRWKHVPTTLDTTEFLSTDSKTYRSYNLTSLAEGQVGEVMVFRPVANRFQIYLNGVPMLPHNYPLTALSPTGATPIAQGKLEPISDFAYSKSQPSKTKVDQEVLDETTKLMIEGMRQGRKPPMGSSGKKALGQNIFIAGKITPDIKEGDLFPLLPPGALGLNASDFSFYKLIKDGLGEKTVNDVYSGDDADIQQTLGQAQQQKEQQMLKLGLALDGVVNLERDLTWLRIYDILMYWTLPTDPTADATREGITQKYKSFSVNTTLSDGKPGVKLFRMQTADTFPEQAGHELEEHALKKKYGKDVRVVYMDPEALRTLKFVWFIIINPTPKSNDKLSQILFVQNLRTAMELFGPESLNLEYVKQRYAILINEDYAKMFRKLDVQTMLQMGLDDPAVQNQLGKPAQNGGAGAPRAAAKPVGVSARMQPVRQ